MLYTIKSNENNFEDLFIFDSEAEALKHANGKEIREYSLDEIMESKSKDIRLRASIKSIDEYLFCKDLYEDLISDTDDDIKFVAQVAKRFDEATPTNGIAIYRVIKASPLTSDGIFMTDTSEMLFYISKDQARAKCRELEAMNDGDEVTLTKLTLLADTPAEAVEALRLTDGSFVFTAAAIASDKVPETRALIEMKCFALLDDAKAVYDDIQTMSASNKNAIAMIKICEISDIKDYVYDKTDKKLETVLDGACQQINREMAEMEQNKEQEQAQELEGELEQDGQDYDDIN